MRQIGKSSEGHLVPIVAIIAGAVVGVVSPVAVAVAARRTKRELDASIARQREALAAERDRLEVTLRAERGRQRADTERELLDRGTVLIAEFRTVAGDVKLDARGKPVVTDAWRQVVHEVAAFRGRLLLWFDDESEIVKAYDGVMALTAGSTAWAPELRSGDRKAKLTRLPRGVASEIRAEKTLEDVDVAHLAYVVASRAHLAAG